MNKTIQEELYYQYAYECMGSPDAKDIIVIVHDQLDCIEKCINSLYKNTNNFKLYLWDNDSMTPTREYLEEVARTHDNVVLVRNSENAGFIKPNNKLASMGDSPYIILLNSDTEVFKGWDSALIGFLKGNPECAIVGYQGNTLEATGKGSDTSKGDDLFDYICGWCLCLPRDIYNKHGLFDEEHLSFAYGEDSDLSLRMKEAGYEIHCLHVKLVVHYGNITALEVHKETDTSDIFYRNHEYIRHRWEDYLLTQRVLVRNV